MATSTGRDGEREPGDAIRLLKNPDGVWTAIDEDTGVASQGDTKADALDNLEDALRLHRGDGETIEDEDAFLESIGIDPDEIPDEPNDLPEFMQ
jgi:predicted RNase H-like HicB family nuclease